MSLIYGKSPFWPPKNDQGVVHPKDGWKHLAAIKNPFTIGWLVEWLLAVHPRNGNPLVRLYGPANTHLRGGFADVYKYVQFAESFLDGSVE